MERESTASLAYAAPATFQRIMEQVFSRLLWKTPLIYLDDVIVICTDFATHRSSVQEVFDCLRAAGLKFKPSKCALLQPEVTYLGQVVDRWGCYRPGECTNCEGVDCPPGPPELAGIGFGKVLQAVHTLACRGGSAFKFANC